MAVGEQNLLDRVLWIAAICWFAYAVTQVRIGAQPDDAKPDSTFLYVGLVIASVAMVKAWVRSKIKRHRIKKATMEAGGPDPQILYANSVQIYYGMSGIGYVVHGIELPTPFSCHYHWRGRYHNGVWDRPGWWQDEWNAYCLGKPSVYDGSKPLPYPYRGAAQMGVPAGPYHTVSRIWVEWWRDRLLRKEAEQAD